jgi:hypothetical protein
MTLGLGFTLVDAITIFALIAGPIVAVIITLWAQSRSEKRAQKQRLFLTLMAHRKSNPPAIEWVNALNLIDVVFSEVPEIVRDWHNLFDVIQQKPQMNMDQFRARYLTLLSGMARHLGYKTLEQVDIDQFYSPDAHGMMVTRQEALQNEFLRVLNASKSFSESN